MLAIVLVGAWWRPDLGPDGPAITTLISSTDPDLTGPQLTEGTVLSQVLTLGDDLRIPADTAFLQACFEVALTVSGPAPAEGLFALELTDVERTASRTYRGAAQDDGAVKAVCVPLGNPLPATITATVRGITGSEGAAVALLVDSTGSFVRNATVVVEAPSMDVRGPLARSVSWTIRRLVAWGPLAVGVGLFATLLPIRQTAVPARVSRNGDFAPRRVSGG
jgi:hypothetical protein